MASVRLRHSYWVHNTIYRYDISIYKQDRVDRTQIPKREERVTDNGEPVECMWRILFLDDEDFQRLERPGPATQSRDLTGTDLWDLWDLHGYCAEQICYQFI